MRSTEQWLFRSNAMNSEPHHFYLTFQENQMFHLPIQDIYRTDALSLPINLMSSYNMYKIRNILMGTEQVYIEYY